MMLGFGKQFLILIFLIRWVCAQSVGGRVTDAASGAPLPTCNVSIENTTRGTATNTDGYYSIHVKPGVYVLKFQYLGYQSEVDSVFVSHESVELDVQLQPVVIPVNPVTIYADRVSDAESLILKVSAMKRRLRSLRNYVCHSYTKITYRSAKNPGIYGGIFETYSELYFNAPDTWHEVLLSQRETANIPRSVNFVSGSAVLDVNADRIHLGDKVITGPTASDAIDHYSFQILDTLYQDHRSVFKIRFYPKDVTVPAMAGDLFITDRLFQIQRIDVWMNPLCNYDMFENIHIMQRYMAVQDSFYVPVYALRENDFVLDIPGVPRILMRRENFRENYRINDLKNRIHPDENTVEITPTLEFSEIPMYIPPLTLEEQSGYHQIDSLVVNNRGIRQMTRLFKLIDIYSDIRSKPVGEAADFIHFNRVEGWFTGAALDTKSIFSPFRLQTGAGYGFSDNEIKYYIVPSVDRVRGRFIGTIALKLFDRLSMVEAPEFPVLLNSTKGLIDGFDFYNYYRNKGSALELTLRVPSWRLKLSVFQEHHRSVHRTVNRGWFSRHRFAENPDIAPGRLTGAELGIVFSSVKYLESDLGRRRIPNKPYAELAVNGEFSRRQWGSEFTYDRYMISLSARQNLSGSVSVESRLLTGTSSGNLPAQRVFVIPGGMSGYDQLKSFSTVETHHFTGNNELALFTEVYMGSFLYRWTGLHIFRDFPVEFSLICNTGWVGEASLNHLTFHDMYSEGGFAVNHILNIIKLEFIFGGSPAEGGQSFVLNVKVEEFDIF